MQVENMRVLWGGESFFKGLHVLLIKRWQVGGIGGKGLDGLDGFLLVALV